MSTDDPGASVRSLLDERPELEPAIESIVELDRAGPWTYDDVDLESGPFGEVVSRSFVESVDGGYRLRNRRAVEAALTGTDVHAEAASGHAWLPSIPAGLADSRILLIAMIGLVAIVAFRSLHVGVVFRKGDIVLQANDPYFYRYWVEELARLSTSNGLLTTITNLPTGVQVGEPFYIVSLFLASQILGGDVPAIGMVMAIYPVISALLTAAIVYVWTTRLEGDRRVGLAALCLLAIVPSHALRTALGFADHHAFDFFWLALAGLGATMVVAARGRSYRWSILLGVAMAGQILAWTAGALLVLPLGLAAGALAIRSRVHPDQSNAVFGGLAIAGFLASMLVSAGHYGLGWQQPFHAIVPLVFLLGILGLWGLVVLAGRLDLGWKEVGALEGVGAVALVGALFLSPWREAATSQFGRLLFPEAGIAETTSILSGELGTLFGPLLLFGFAIILALPVMIGHTSRGLRGTEPSLIVPASYAWVLLSLAALQLRFAGEAGVIVAVFAGIGFIQLLAWVDLAEGLDPSRTPTAEPRWWEPNGLERGDGVTDILPAREQVGAVILIVVLVASLGTIQSGVKVQQVAVDPDQHDTARWMETFANDAGMNTSERYVFSRWDQNRFYNYYVRGVSQSYAYAQQNFYNFSVQPQPSAMPHQEIRRRVGFVVTTDDNGRFGPSSMHSRLHDHWGGAGENTSGLGLYQALFGTDDGEYKVFRPVEGAILTGRGTPNSTVSITSNVSIGSTDGDERTVSYRREADTTRRGHYVIRVANPGTYTAAGESISVDESTIESGGWVRERGGPATYHFDAGSGIIAFDERNHNHAFAFQTEWRRGISNTSLRFNGVGYARVPEATDVIDPTTGTVSLWMKTDQNASYTSEQFDRVQLLSTVRNDTSLARTRGIQLRLDNGSLRAGLGNGEQASVLEGPAVTGGTWRQVTLTWNQSTTSFYVDGERVDSVESSSEVAQRSQLVFGGSRNFRESYVGQIDEAIILERSLSPTEVADRYQQFSE